MPFKKNSITTFSLLYPYRSFKYPTASDDVTNQFMYRIFDTK